MMTEEWASELGRMPLADAQEILAQLPERLAEGKQPLALTRSGDPVLAVLPWDLFESLVETLEIMSDHSLMAAIRDDLSGADEQTLVPIEQLLAELDGEEEETQGEQA